MQHSPTTNIAVLKQAFSHLNAANIDGCLSLMTPDFIINIAEMPYPKRGHKAWRKHAEILFDAFPDAQVYVEDIIAADDEVAVRVRIKGTHRGEFLGNPPTGKAIEYTSHEVYRFENGKIAEEWICSDSLTLMMQIGALSQTRLISMWLSGYRFWFGLSIGALITAALHGLYAKHFWALSPALFVPVWLGGVLCIQDELGEIEHQINVLDKSDMDSGVYINMYSLHSRCCDKNEERIALMQDSAEKLRIYGASRIVSACLAKPHAVADQKYVS